VKSLIWSGQVLETIDYAGFIGRNPGNENVYVHTGDFGQGITHGAVGGLLNSALILGDDAKWAEVYAPSRKTPSAVGNLLKENVSVGKTSRSISLPANFPRPMT
jgi:glycine/D-amino acid oxidase-like deaminating enzyme